MRGERWPSHRPHAFPSGPPGDQPPSMQALRLPARGVAAGEPAGLAQRLEAVEHARRPDRLPPRRPPTGRRPAASAARAPLLRAPRVRLGAGTGWPSSGSSRAAGSCTAAAPSARPQLVGTGAAAAIDTPMAQCSSLSVEERAVLAESLGYQKIGAELPDSVTLSEIVKSMPPEVRRRRRPIGGGPPGGSRLGGSLPRSRAALTPSTQVFELDHGKAWGAVLTSIMSMSACLYIISISPWYLLPFAWALAGTAFTGVSAHGRRCQGWLDGSPPPCTTTLRLGRLRGCSSATSHRGTKGRLVPPPRLTPLPPPLPPAQFFVVGHDAGHRSFHKNNLVEDIVGTLMFAPLIFPFEPWRIKHNVHHAHTNKCAVCAL
jgi:hypothetical protein